MKKLQIAIATAFIATSGASFAQSQSTSDPMRAGESPRCDAMTGEARTQCLQDENAKTQSAPAESSSSGASAAPSSSDSASSGSSAAPTTAPAAGSEANSTPSASDSIPQGSGPGPQGESK
jgi:hyperosmotically inducible protein